MEPPYDALPGVISTTSGYIGGRTANPTYEQVSSGTTGHTEAVQVVYDPAKVTYEKLLEVFWVNIDPTVRDRQFCDAGTPVPDRDLLPHAKRSGRRPRPPGRRSRSRAPSRRRS